MDRIAAVLAAAGGTSSRRLEFGAGSSDLGRAIADAAGRGPDAVLLLSDGNHNSGPSPVEAAAAAGVPVHAVGFGPVDAGPIPAIGPVACPDQVEVGERFTVRAAARGGAGRLRWTLSEEGREIARTETAGGARPAVLAVSAANPGLHRYRLRLEDDAGRGDAVGLTVLAGRSRIDVVWVESSPGWNLRFASQALATDPAIRWRAFAQLAGRLVRADGAAPVAADSLARCDVLVLSGGGGTPLPGLERTVVRAVLANGGGVLVIGDSPLAIAPLRRVPGSAALAGPVQFEPGWRQFGIAPAADSALQSVTRRGPPLSLRAACLPSDSGVTVLATVRAGNAAQVPLLAARYSGGGRVMQFASDGLWQWRLGLAGVQADTRFFDQLVTGMVRWLGGREQEGLGSGTDRCVYSTGDRPGLRGRWRGWEASRGAGARWSAVVIGPSGFRRAVMLDDWGQGDYGVDLEPLDPGTYSYRTTLAVNGRTVHRGQGRFFVEPARDESSGITQNRELLREVAAASGGRYSDADSLPGDGGFPGTVGIRGDRTPTHERLLAVVLGAAALLVAEWAVRRRYGLR